MYLKITYYHSGLDKIVTDLVCGAVEIKEGYAWFKSGGHGRYVPLKYVKNIEAA